MDKLVQKVIRFLILLALIVLVVSLVTDYWSNNVHH